MSEPVLHNTRVNGVQLAWFERGQRQPGRATLLFVHATGFHGRIWDYIIEAFPDQHVLALEQRGHGRSAGGPIDSWQVFGRDMAAFVAELGLDQLIGVAHSMGAHGMIDAAALSGAFARLVLLDPTVSAPEVYADTQVSTLFADGEHPAARRKDRFASVDEMQARLLGKSSFALYHPRMFRDYCQYGLKAAEDGSLQLACRPAMEASVYLAARTNGGVLASARAVSAAVTVVRAKQPPAERSAMDFASSPTWPGLWSQFPHGREYHWSQCTHFIPMQMPDRVIELVRRELAAWHYAWQYEHG